MKFSMHMAIAGTFLSLAACSSGGGDIPNVAGGYDCTTNCSGACDFSGSITITQNDNSIIIETGEQSQVGSINEDGEIDVSSDDGECSGQIVQGTAVLDCTIGGVDCQQVTFKHQ